MPDHRSRLKRLPPEYYQGEAWVHWTMAMRERKCGWLDLSFYCTFRELLVHVGFRYQLACPVFFLMPDHMHLLLCGLAKDSDQQIAIRQLRKYANEILRRVDCEFQRQPYDHVLREDELKRCALENTMEYIARNPERKGIVAQDGFAGYPFSGCLLPGYPDVKLFGPRGWDAVWSILACLRRTECFRLPDLKYQPPESLT